MVIDDIEVLSMNCYLLELLIVNTVLNAQLLQYFHKLFPVWRKKEHHYFLVRSMTMALDGIAVVNVES